MSECRGQSCRSVGSREGLYVMVIIILVSVLGTPSSTQITNKMKAEGMCVIEGSAQ